VSCMHVVRLHINNEIEGEIVALLDLKCHDQQWNVIARLITAEIGIRTGGLSKSV